jgi:type IV pilus assembly protein PilV
MRTLKLSPFAQRGIVMIDALVAVVIFSIGIVGMITLQGQAVNLASAAKYRTDAAMMAEQVIGQMWASNNATAGVLGTNFNSPAGVSYKAWAAKVQSASTGLPGAAGLAPTIVVDANNQVTVTVFWQAPSDANPHQYVTQTQIQP